MSAFMKLGSASEPDLNCTTSIYVCLVGNITPANISNVGESRDRGSSGHGYDDMNDEVGTSKDNEATIEVQRSAAFHELLESRRVRSKKDLNHPNIEEDNSKTILMPKNMDDNSEDDSDDGNPKLLGLTRTQWLSQSRDGSPDARKLQLSPSTSETSSASEENDGNVAYTTLSKVLALDKEHNLFGLSNIMIAGQKLSKKHKEKNSKGIFHQTAIVHVCYKQCCRRRSKSDLPASLKCGGCRVKCCCSRCSSVVCGSSCGIPCGYPCGRPCPTRSPPFTCRKPCPPKPCLPKPCPTYPPCTPECGRFGLQVTVIRKPKYDPEYPEIVPKSSCILQKPIAARPCNHTPRCQPPSSCFPYFMPCYWPARSSAPCCEPSCCFHNPPCPKGRAPRSRIVPEELCPTRNPCTGAEKNQKCENLSCIGRNNEALKKAITDVYGGRSKG